MQALEQPPRTFPMQDNGPVASVTKNNRHHDCGLPISAPHRSKGENQRLIYNEQSDENTVAPHVSWQPVNPFGGWGKDTMDCGDGEDDVMEIDVLDPSKASWTLTDLPYTSDTLLVVRDHDVSDDYDACKVLVVSAGGQLYADDIQVF